MEYGIGSDNVLTDLSTVGFMVWNSLNEALLQPDPLFLVTQEP